ncbi:MAG TPA: cyclic pyranopterin monophosphate synthase MoaC [Planctomycetes bacterium]|nr:cyclic pyranopterin monophosphate synthase MoaC [Planctomycetota bacterium]
MNPTDSDPGGAQGRLSHLEGEGRTTRSRMVDVAAKPVSVRTALARSVVRFPRGVLAGILRDGGPKGPIEEVARTAAILAAKRTGDLIPMCHPLALDHVQVDFSAEGDRLEILASAKTSGRTGVEMEAMCAAAVAALTVYDMTKAVSKGIRIEAVELREKTGGKSGPWTAPD